MRDSFDPFLVTRNVVPRMISRSQILVPFAFRTVHFCIIFFSISLIFSFKILTYYLARIQIQKRGRDSILSFLSKKSRPISFNFIKEFCMELHTNKNEVYVLQKYE